MLKFTGCLYSVVVHARDRLIDFFFMSNQTLSFSIRSPLGDVLGQQNVV